MKMPKMYTLSYIYFYIRKFNYSTHVKACLKSFATNHIGIYVRFYILISNLYHPFLMIVLPSWERSHMPSQKSFLSRCFSGWNPFGGVGFLVFWRELPLWFDLGKASTLPLWSASWTPFRRGAKKGGNNAVLSQVANVFMGDFWLVVGCWLQLWLELWLWLCSCNCPFTSPASLSGESYSITWICRGSRNFGINANTRKSNHSYLRLLQASPAILLAWFTSNPKFSNRFCRKISSGSPLSLHRYGTRCGYDRGDFVCHVPKLCAQTKGFHLKLFHFYTVNIFFTCFLILFQGMYMKLNSVRRNLRGDFWIIQIEEWITNQKDHMCWGLNSLFCSLSG